MKLPLTALFIAIFVPVQGKEKNTQPATNRHHADDSKKPSPETLPAAPPAQIDVINQQATAKEVDGTKNHPANLSDHHQSMKKLRAGRPEEWPTGTCRTASVASLQSWPCCSKSPKIPAEAK